MNQLEAVVGGATIPTAAPSKRRPWRLLGHIAASVSVDVVLLAAFAHAGIVSAVVPVLYALVTGCSILVFYILLRSDWSQRRRDPALTRSQLLVSSLTVMGFSLYCEPLAFYFLMLLFMAFSFAALRLRLKQMLTSFVLVMLVGTIDRLWLGTHLEIPGATPTEQLLGWLAFASVLLRCCMIGWYGNRLRRTLHQRNRELADASQQIQYLALHDSLTGTLRRTPVWNLIERQCGLNIFSVAMLDLDHFKQINDRYGHAIGDDVLRRFAETVRDVIRPGDVVGRYGGEEFLLLLPGANADAALAITDRVRRAVARHDWARLAEGLCVTVSIGIAGAALGESARSMVDRADQALYAAKRHGRNRVLLYRSPTQFEGPAGDSVGE
ncbi:GGDEF domain-containing protein [Solimonas marina]|uniref:diguanylate cyclase n=1 Tax=Solimonas marina TaxID=2714601 RepID=A0A969W6V2_9GAMM|nr:GGDEF domain-containing protein [Solimonas marina]NKF21028.1 GGDEF domain-containing protein [Solimonas marina]